MAALLPSFRRGLFVCHLSDVNPDGAGSVPREFLNFLSFHRDGGGNGEDGGCGADEARCPRGIFGALPSPLWGGVGGGGRCWRTQLVRTNNYPPPHPSPQGGREQTEFAVERIAHLAMDRRVKPGDDSLCWAAMAANPAKLRTVFAWRASANPAMTVCRAMTGGTRPVDEEDCRSAHGKHCRSGVG